MFLDFLILRFLCKIKIFSGPDLSIFQNALWYKMGCSGPLKPTLKCFQWHESVQFAISIAGTEMMKPSLNCLCFFLAMLYS